MLSLPTRLSSVRTCVHRAAVCRRPAQRANSTTAPASTSNPSSTQQPDCQFPYPTNRNPTPYQIFHLPRNASESDVKARYFDLVRLYHPDKPGLSVSPEVAHAQFQAITAAYDVLRGKTPLGSAPSPSGSKPADTTYRSTATWRAVRQRRQELYNSGAADESWKDKIIILGVVGTILIVVYETTTTRREAMAEAVARSRNYGVYREYQQSQVDERLAEPTSHQKANPKS